MKPFAPEEVDGKDTPNEGLMIVGTKGKILGGFRGEDPVLLPESKMASRPDSKHIDSEKVERNTSAWIEAIKSGNQTPGSFIRAQTITDTINLGAVALRADKKVDFNSSSLKITNYLEATNFLTREYRTGWEI
jgi:hypothetical protein